MIWQGLIMFLQNKYQERRHYVRTSLGKTNQTDSYSTETLIEKPTDLKVLIPLLFITYLIEISISINSLLNTQLTLIKGKGLSHDQWSAICSAVLFLILGVGNALTTLNVVRRKHIKRMKSMKSNNKKQ
jgi:hypothetical protein